MTAQARFFHEFESPKTQQAISETLLGFVEAFLEYSDEPADHISSIRSKTSDAWIETEDFMAFVDTPPAPGQAFSAEMFWRPADRFIGLRASPDGRHLFLSVRVPQDEEEKAAKAIADFRNSIPLDEVAKRVPYSSAEARFRITETYRVDWAHASELCRAVRTHFCDAQGYVIDTVLASSEIDGGDRSRPLDDLGELPDHIAQHQPCAFEITAKRPHGPENLSIIAADDGHLRVYLRVQRSGVDEAELGLRSFAKDARLTAWVPLYKAIDALSGRAECDGWLDAGMFNSLPQDIDASLKAMRQAGLQWLAVVVRRRGDALRRIPDQIDASKLAGLIAPFWQDHDWVWIEARSPEIFVRLEVEPKLQTGKLIVQSNDDEAAKAVCDQLFQDLQMETQREPPYRDFQYSRSFAVPAQWSSERFAKLLGDAAAFRIDKNPMLISASVSTYDDAKIEHRQNCDTVQKWFTRLRAPEPYADALLDIRGPRGRQLLVRLTDNRRQLTFRATMPRDEFEQMLDEFRNELNLGAVAEPRAPRNLFERVLDVKTTMGKTALLIGGVVTGFLGYVADDLKELVFPDYQMVLLSPPTQKMVEDQAMAALAAGCVVISWELRQDSLRPTNAVSGLGEVVILDRGSRFNVSIPDHQSGRPIHLPPGDFNIFVRDNIRVKKTGNIWVSTTNQGYDSAAANAACGDSPIPDSD